MDLITKIRNTKTMPELDGLRLETVKQMKILGENGFQVIQKEFIKAKKRLKRIPLRDRTW